SSPSHAVSRSSLLLVLINAANSLLYFEPSGNREATTTDSVPSTNYDIVSDLPESSILAIQVIQPPLFGTATIAPNLTRIFNPTQEVAKGRTTS
ncbi:hypothetical protein BC826DRAFT_1187167, partial [Russula brevipes]